MILLMSLWSALMASRSSQQNIFLQDYGGKGGWNLVSAQMCQLPALFLQIFFMLKAESISWDLSTFCIISDCTQLRSLHPLHRISRKLRLEKLRVGTILQYQQKLQILHSQPKEHLSAQPLSVMKGKRDTCNYIRPSLQLGHMRRVWLPWNYSAVQVKTTFRDFSRKYTKISRKKLWNIPTFPKFKM